MVNGNPRRVRASSRIRFRSPVDGRCTTQNKNKSAAFSSAVRSIVGPTRRTLAAVPPIPNGRIGQTKLLSLAGGGWSFNGCGRSRSAIMTRTRSAPALEVETRPCRHLYNDPNSAWHGDQPNAIVVPLCAQTMALIFDFVERPPTDHTSEF